MSAWGFLQKLHCWLMPSYKAPFYSLPHVVPFFVVNSDALPVYNPIHSPILHPFIYLHLNKISASAPMTSGDNLFLNQVLTTWTYFLPPLSIPSSSLHILLCFHRKIRQWANKHHISFNCLEHRCAAPPAHTYQQRQQIHELFRTCQHQILIASS